MFFGLIFFLVTFLKFFLGYTMHIIDQVYMCFLLLLSPNPHYIVEKITWGLYWKILVSGVIVYSPIYYLFYWNGEHKNSQGKLWCFVVCPVSHRSKKITFIIFVP